MKRDRSDAHDLDAHDLPEDRLPAQARKGRGAVTNRAGRFEPTVTEAVDDGWPRDAEDLPPLRTTVTVDSSRSIIARNQSPDVPFDRSINPYRGCEHGCVYCFARPTHAFLGLSPGLDFETRLFVKPEAARLLAYELAKPGYRPRVIAMGTNTDPYQPLERERRITRSILEVLSACDHPVGIVTKAALIARDADILASMAAKRLARAFISVTTLDRDLARTLEPRAPTPMKRLAAVRALAEAGVPVGVMVAPVIPVLTDPEMERILAAAKEAGATSAGYVLLRLPLEIKDLFTEWLEAHAPAKARHVLDLVRDTRAGRLNDASFGRRMTGQGTYAQLIHQRFELATKKLGLHERDWRYDLTLFKPPARPAPPSKADTRQLALF
jgi:DNA repair photolyase